MEILDLMSDPHARLLCVSDNGAEVLEPPTELGEWPERTLRPDAPLDVFTPESQGAVVSAFLAAIVKGHATETAVLVETDQPCQVDAFDRRDVYGSVVVVTSSTTNTFVSDQPNPVRVPVRRCMSAMDGAGRILWVDEDYERMLGYSSEEVVGRSAATVIHPDDIERSIVAFADTLQRPFGESRIRVRAQHKDGRWMWIEFTRTNLLHTERPQILSEALDVSMEMSTQLELQRREALLAQLTETLPIGVLHIDHEERVELANSRWIGLTGIKNPSTLEEIVGTFAESEELLAKLRAAAKTGGDMSVVVDFVSPEIGSRQGRLRQQMVVTADDLDPPGFLLTLDDITESLTFQQELSKQARTDHLTSSLNRLGIEEQIGALLAESMNYEVPLQLLYFDLDDFKAVNDVLGHSAGDAVLQETVQCIRQAVRPHDLVGRVGGDEFIVVLRGIAQEQVGLVAARIQTQLEEHVGVSASVGSSTARPGDDFESFVFRADKAMYVNKRDRRQIPAATWENWNADGTR